VPTRPSRPILAVLATALVLAFASHAAAVVLCRKRSGRVVVADATCGRRQTAITAQELGFVGPPGADGTNGGPGDPGVVPYRVVDAMGSPVGIVQSVLVFRTQVVLVHPAIPIPIQFEVIDGRIAPSELGDVLRYASADCTGTPFIRDGGSPLPRARLIGDTLYYATGQPTPQAFASMEMESDPCAGTPTSRGTCCLVQAASIPGSAATGLLLTTLGIVEPFTVEARP